MLRILEAVPAATGTGIDLNEHYLARGRANATSRGLAQRVEFVAGSATGTTPKAADLVLCLGARHALSDKQPPGQTPAEALRFLRRLVTPGDRVLLGEGFWERPPAAAELAAMWQGASAALPDLAGLVDLAVAAGFRPERIEPASNVEWDDFESGYLADVEEWLATHDDPQVRARADKHRSRWLRGYRGVIGRPHAGADPGHLITAGPPQLSQPPQRLPCRPRRRSAPACRTLRLRAGPAKAPLRQVLPSRLVQPRTRPARQSPSLG